MALPIWQRTITTESGDVIPGAEVEVVNEATGLAADIFSNRAGTTPLTNPFFTGADGFAQFFVAPGEYRITATGPTGSITWRFNVLTGDAALMTNNTGGATLGTVAAQNANAVAITGGTVNATTLQQGGSQAYARSNILGTVSQSGGVPTGAVIQRGSNANGEFVRYADGTQLCWASRSSGATGAATWPFPTSFVNTTNLNVQATANTGFGGGVSGVAQVFNQTTSSVSFTAVNTNSATILNQPIFLKAIGRWY